MNIVIIGAGTLGTYIASLLSQEKHNVILVDKEDEPLQQAAWQLDVATQKGSGSHWKLLDNLLDLNPDILIALTGSDETNMVACSLAKHLGYPRTLCRVKDDRYLNKSRLDFARIFDVDYFICPELLVAGDILKILKSSSSIALDYFAHGAVQMRTLAIPPNWREAETTLQHLPLPKGVLVGLVQSEFDAKGEPLQGGHRRLFFPHGSDCIHPGDQVTLIGEVEPMESIHQFFGIEQGDVKSVVIIGGSQIGVNLAKTLAAREMDVRIIDKDFETCRRLSEALPFTTIMHHDGTDLSFLLSEKVGRADALVCSTGSDEVNLLASTLGRQAGSHQVVSVLKSKGYETVLDRMGIHHKVSPLQAAANHILSLASSVSVSSLVSLYDHQAEVIEVAVSSRSRIVGIPLSELGPLLPRDFLIAMIQNRGRIMIAHGNRIISPGDTVVVFCHPRHFEELEKIF